MLQKNITKMQLVSDNDEKIIENIDSTKAFDTVSHDKLLLSLGEIGRRCIVLKLLRDYRQIRK